MKSTTLLFATFTLLIFACNPPREPSQVINTNASLPNSFDFEKMGLKVINTSINKKEGTTSTFYGNEEARKRLVQSIGSNPLAGEQMALTTWKQKEDEHWFGAKIPDELLSVEVIKTGISTSKAPVIIYTKFVGKALIPSSDTLANTSRIKFILGQKASVMP